MCSQGSEREKGRPAFSRGGRVIEVYVCVYICVCLLICLYACVCV